MLEVRVISIGTLSSHPLWNERGAVRTGHSTTTLVRSGGKSILIDPGLPASILTARLKERANCVPADITHVFLTSFHPETRRGLPAFESASWLISEREREVVGVSFAQQLKELMLSDRRDEDDGRMLRETLQTDLAILQRCEAAPDQIADLVDLMPAPGVTPGLCGLVLEDPRHTIVIAGDAIATAEHLEQGKVLQTAADPDLARESFQDIVELADLIICGRDNLLTNPTKRAF